MTSHFWYRIPPVYSISVYTWGSCSLSMSYSRESLYCYPFTWQPEEENCNYFLANCYDSISKIRAIALNKQTVGPKILVMGAAFSGKNTVTRTLVNYSVKLGWETMYLDLDPQNNEIAPIGTVAAASFSEYMPVVSA